MLLQVNTTHGKTFWCANQRFEPRPRRLWCSDGEPPGDAERITPAQLRRIETFTGDHGPLFVERDVPPMRAAELDDLHATVETLTASNKKLKKQLRETRAAAKQRDGELETLRGQVASLEAALAESQESR